MPKKVEMYEDEYGQSFKTENEAIQSDADKGLEAALKLFAEENNSISDLASFLFLNRDILAPLFKRYNDVCTLKKAPPLEPPLTEDCEDHLDEVLRDKIRDEAIIVQTMVDKLKQQGSPPRWVVLPMDWEDSVDEFFLGLDVVFSKKLPPMVLSEVEFGRFVARIEAYGSPSIRKGELKMKEKIRRGGAVKGNSLETLSAAFDNGEYDEMMHFFYRKHMKFSKDISEELIEKDINFSLADFYWGFTWEGELILRNLNDFGCCLNQTDAIEHAKKDFIEFLEAKQCFLFVTIRDGITSFERSGIPADCIEAPKLWYKMIPGNQAYGCDVALADGRGSLRILSAPCYGRFSDIALNLEKAGSGEKEKQSNRR